MKRENNDMTEDLHGIGDGAQSTAKGKPSGKMKKEKKRASGVRLPFLIEFTYTVSTVILIVLAIVIGITSFLAGAGLFTIVLRIAVAVTVVGVLLVLISSQISSGLLFSVKLEHEEAQRKQEEAALSMPHEDSAGVEA